MVDKNIYIQELSVAFPVKHGYLQAVDQITTQFDYGSITTIIGESGCGKSVLAQAILGMLPGYVQIGGQVRYQALDILTISSQIRQQLYRHTFGLIPQNPAESLNPLRKIYKQMADILLLRQEDDRKHTRKTELLAFFGLTDGERVLQAYAHELSGGMQQRVLCAMGLANNPDWLIADEPTKGLDERVCSVVYDNLLKIKQTTACSLLIITHDIKLARLVSDQIAVMYAGQILEQGPDVFTQPQHPYTQAFLAALPENGLQTMPDAYQQLVSIGCKFAPRCRFCTERCQQETPPVYTVASAKVRCFLYAPRS